MTTRTAKARMNKRKNIVLIAHDNRKHDLLEWVRYNKGPLGRHNLFAHDRNARRPRDWATRAVL